MARAPDGSTITWAAPVPFHPAIVPLSVEKMKRARAPPMRKLVASPLNTRPVGAPATPTVSGTLPPTALYSVEASTPLSATHQGVVGPATSPHAFTRFVSVVVPGTPLFDTSGVTV